VLFTVLSVVVWKLREAIAKRKITVVALASEMGVCESTISHLKGKDKLPKIGADRIEEIRKAIDNLSRDRYGECRTSELVEVED